MKADMLLEAMSGIDDKTINETVELFKPPEKKVIKGSFRTLLIAAVIVSVFAALGAAAYAKDFLGIRTLLKPDSSYEAGGREYTEVSITRPQEIPEDVPDETVNKFENSEKAWAEWTEYKENKAKDNLPLIAKESPEEAHGFSERENPDGSFTITFKKMQKEADGKTLTEIVLKEITVSAEDMKEFDEYAENESKAYPGYDFTYRVKSEQDAVALEEIASKYNLNLRRSYDHAYSSETTGQTGERFYTNQQLAEMTSQIGCSGNIFYDTPPGYDKMYWYNEGSFCVSYYVKTPSGIPLNCYARNNMYSTLTSGDEVGISESNIESFTERRHTAPDGTELTILSNNKSAYIYVYLKDSYFVEKINIYDYENPINFNSDQYELSEADINFVADYINYSLIGE